MKLNFLLNHENTHYKLVEDISDLTYAQTHFMYFCAKEEEEKLRDIQNGTRSESLPLDITASDSPEDVREKFNIITECLV